MNRSTLEERLINFAVSIVEITGSMPRNKAATHLSGQLIRSGTSSALNYGEAQSAESRKDFVHKMKLVLKELRESYSCLRIVHKTKLYKNEESILKALSECNEIISIFVKSIGTAEKNIQES